MNVSHSGLKPAAECQITDDIFTTDFKEGSCCDEFYENEQADSLSKDQFKDFSLAEL